MVSVNGMDFSLPSGILEVWLCISLRLGQENPVFGDLTEQDQASLNIIGFHIS